MSNQNILNQLIKSEDCKSKEEVRHQIDLIDMELIQLFAKRFEYVETIVQFKEKNEKAIIDAARKEDVIQQRSKWAAELGLDKKTFAQIFRLLIEHNISKELKILEKEKEINIG